MRTEKKRLFLFSLSISEAVIGGCEGIIEGILYYYRQRGGDMIFFWMKM